VESTSCRRPFRHLKRHCGPSCCRSFSRRHRAGPSQPEHLSRRSGTLKTIVRPPTGHRGSTDNRECFRFRIGWETVLGGMFCRYSRFSGVAFGLNPLGDEGDVLPVTLTTTVSGRTFVRGLAILGFSVGSMLLLLQDCFWAVQSFNTTDLTAALLLAAALLWCFLYCLHLQPEFGFPGLVQFRWSGSKHPPAELDGEYTHGIIVFGFVVRCALGWFLPEGTRSIIADSFDGSLLPLVWVAERGVGLSSQCSRLYAQLIRVGNLAPGVIQLRLRWRDRGLVLSRCNVLLVCHQSVRVLPDP